MGVTKHLLSIVKGLLYSLSQQHPSSNSRFYVTQRLVLRDLVRLSQCESCEEGQSLNSGLTGWWKGVRVLTWAAERQS